MPIHWFRFSILLILMSSLASYAEDLLPDQRRAKQQDALYGQALYSLHSGEYDKALSLNSALRHQNNQGYGKILDIHEATAKLGLGMSRSAANQYQALLSDERSTFLSSKAKAQAWFYLAKHFYTKGMWRTALQAIRKIQATQLNSVLKDEYHFIAATLELFKGNSNKADRHILAIDKNSKWAAYAFLNLAVSYTERDVRISKVDAMFNQALLLAANTERPEALTDRIHLMAGQFFFATGRGRSAIRHLKSVSLNGAYTPKALLAYGWALTEQWQYHDALQPWYMLKTAHSQLNQDVQETLIAIPYLLEKLNAKVMALGAFDYATEQYDIVYKKLEESAKRLDTGEFIEPLLAQQIPDKWGAFSPIDLTLPNHPDRIYLKDVMSQNYFLGELKSLRDLHVMRYQLNNAIDQLDAFSKTVNTRETEYQQIKSENIIADETQKLLKLKSRYESVREKVEIAFSDPSGYDLASNSEKHKLASFNKVSDSINKLRLDDSADYQQRLRRVEGVLKWSLSERYHERKKIISRNLAVLKASIIKTSKQLDATKFAYQVSPNNHQGFSQKISKLKKNYQKQLAKLNKVYIKQQEKVGGIVRADIKNRQERVMEYQLQARLAAARLFDETSNKVRTAAAGDIRQ